MQPRGVLETCLYAADLAAAERFYASVLGLEVIDRQAERHVFFRCGRGVLLLFNPAHTSHVETFVGGSAIPLHGASGPGHAAFAVREAELPQWRGRLAAAGVAIESEIDWPGGGRSIYFRDPAGNSLELATPKLWGLAEKA
ncbi:MAG: VOC family protein [Planctomycetia bacterium]|nr:VOC family protein [Planctomycetia bacterium]